MSRSAEKIWAQVQQNLRNIRFGDFCRLIEWFGFIWKGGKGSHRTYFHSGIREIMDVQPLGGEAKPYQLHQLIRLVEHYQLKGGYK